MKRVISFSSQSIFFVTISCPVSLTAYLSFCHTFFVDTGVWTVRTGCASIDPTEGGPPASMLSSPTPSPNPSTSCSSFGVIDASYTIYVITTLFHCDTLFLPNFIKKFIFVHANLLFLRFINFCTHFTYSFKSYNIFYLYFVALSFF